MSIEGQKATVIQAVSLADEVLVNREGTTARQAIDKFALQLMSSSAISSLSDAKQLYPIRAALPAASTQALRFAVVVFNDPDGNNNGTWSVQLDNLGAKQWVWSLPLQFSVIRAADLGDGTSNAIEAISKVPVADGILTSFRPYRDSAAGPVTVSFNDDAPLTIRDAGASVVVGPAAIKAGVTISGFRSGVFFDLITDLAAAASAAGAAASAAQAAIARQASEEARDEAQDLVDSVPALITGKAEKATTVSAAGLATGGGSLAADRIITVSKSSSAQAVAGTDDATAMTPVRTKDAVKDVPWAADNNTLYKSRSNKDRWLDSYRLADEVQFSGAGVATDAAVLQALFNRAKAAGRGEVILPRGDIRLEVACALINAGGAQHIRLVGQGPEVTRFLNISASQHFFDLGDAAVARTYGITLEGFSVQPNVTMDNSGSGFFMRNTTDIAFKDVICRGMKNGWSLGVGASVTNDVVYTTLSNCGGTSSGASGVPMIRLGSGGILNITGGASRWNANGGHNFIDQDNPSHNWDGFYLSGQFFEFWNKYLCSTGKGMVNVEWTGCQVDRAAVFFQAEPGVATGSNRNWNIHDVQVLGFPAGGGIGLLTSKGSSTDTQAVEDIMVSNCVFNGLSDAAMYAAHGELFAYNNRIVSCAQLGASAPLGGALIRVGQGVCDIAGNFGRRALSSPGLAYRYGIQWDGATLATRYENDNKFIGFGAGAQTGTK